MSENELTPDDARRVLEVEKNARAKRAFDIIRAVLAKEQCELHFMQQFVDGQMVRAEWAVIPKETTATPKQPTE